MRVVAGTGGCTTRRWNGRGGGRRWVPGIGGVQSSSGSVSLEKVSTLCSSAETDSGGTGLEHAESAGAVASEFDRAESEPSGVAGAETDFYGLMLQSTDGTGAVAVHSLCLVLCPGKEATPAVTPCAVNWRLPACSLLLCLRIWPALR